MDQRVKATYFTSDKTQTLFEILSGESKTAMPQKTHAEKSQQNQRPASSSTGPKGVAIAPPGTLQNPGSNGVIQGVFQHKDDTVNTKEEAESLAEKTYKRLARTPKLRQKITQTGFSDLLVDLATSNQDHGKLDDDYFLRILREGRQNENFSFQVEGRRIETTYAPKPNFPPQPSFFQQRLSTPKPKKKRGEKKDEDEENASDIVLDLSYNDLRGILENTLEHHISPEDIDQAIQTGVKNFTASQSEVTLEPQYNSDLQLLPIHLLKYQSFNRGQLQDKPENTEENKFRALVLEISKQMITSASRNLTLIIPPTPDFSQKGQLQYALPGLIDVNRPLANSIFGQETYKAVFLLTHQLLRKAYDQAQLSLSEKPKEHLEPFTIKEQIDEQRKFYNQSFFELLPNMTGSTIKKREGKEYVTNQLRIPYNDENDSFDEASDEEDTDISSDEEIYDPGDNLFRSAEKRSTFLNSFGTLSKLTSQKQLLDEQNDTNKEKYRRQHERINRRTRGFNKKYQPTFTGITQELAYVTKKEKLIYQHIDKIKDEITLLEFLIGEDEITGVKPLLRTVQKENPVFREVSTFNKKHASVRANTKNYKNELAKLRKNLQLQKIKKSKIQNRIKALEQAQQRADKSLTRLSNFYFNKPVGNLLEERRNTSWRGKYPEVFKRLGPKTFQSYLFKPAEKRQREEKEERSPENKREKKRPRRK